MIVSELRRRVLSRSAHVTASRFLIGGFEIHCVSSLVCFEPLLDCGEFKRVCQHSSGSLCTEEYSPYETRHSQVIIIQLYTGRNMNEMICQGS